MHLHDVMGWPGPMTHRQFEAWQSWLTEDLNEPDKTQHYLMRIAQRVEQSYSKRAVTLESQKIEWRFDDPDDDDYEVTLEDGRTVKPPKRLTEEDIIRIEAEEAKREVRRRDERGRGRTPDRATGRR